MNLGNYTGILWSKQYDIHYHLLKTICHGQQLRRFFHDSAHTCDVTASANSSDLLSFDAKPTYTVGKLSNTNCRLLELQASFESPFQKLSGILNCG